MTKIDLKPLLMILLLLMIMGCTQNKTKSEYFKLQEMIMDDEPTMADRTDPSSCETEDSMSKDVCYYWVAQNTKNEVLCEKMVGLDPIFTKNDCYSQIARITKNDNLCEKIIIENDFEKDKNKCYFFVAFNSKNPEICEKIENNDDYKATCILRAIG